ncbi:Efflux transporter periplasmic adaptor subunit [Denitratisoma oestradiolicum]|uniref:Efflux transporter periplasmic adaptor subunit n=2 Tax=Denitratisoma oestradiolicum TaxID=311182 RepID=A0A6S6XRU3_9PROT|nr:hypothetical protein CBW56_13140 [Denitratisoma oestradiolicum]CAB1367445.1 Efflux transporter periplasmic adaptor subunit [Denitratisoma oestradiolicum]
MMRPWLISVLCCLTLAGCGEQNAAPAADRMVETLVVGTGAARVRQEYSGEVRARQEATLSFRVGGKLLARLVDPGATVRAGQPLARLDDADAAQQYAQAAAQRDLAAADLGRFRELREQNFVSPAALEAREVTYRAAEAQATLARNQRTYTTLVADRAGIVSAIMAEPGQVLAPGQPVLRLAPAGEREIAFQIPESDRVFVQSGDLALVRLWAIPGREYRGRVREIAGAADSATRSYDARVSLTDGDDTIGLGMTATVDLHRETSKQLRLPHGAIFQQEPGKTGAAVWVVANNGTATLRPVQVLRWGDDAAWISGDLTPGERVVAAGVHKVHAGEKLRYTDRKF